MKRHSIILVASLLSSISLGVECEQKIKISTSTARFNVKFDPEPDRNLRSTNQHFQFESATSKFFHTELTTHANNEEGDGADTRVVVTSVHVERMRKEDATKELNYDGDAATLVLESVVSATFSDVGLSPPDVASILTKAVSSSNLLKVLVAANLITDDTTLEISFAEFDGSPDERGISSAQTDIVIAQTVLVTKRQNEEWPMFFAGITIALLAVSIVSVVYWICKAQRAHSSPSAKASADDNGPCNNSLHYEGDVDLDLEVATTASGVLGLKGHHPNIENMHPNKKAYRRNRWGQGTSSSSKTDATTVASTSGTPRTQKSGVASVSPKSVPLGITSMTKLESFLTPQKPKSDRLQMYDIDRLTMT